MVRDGRQFARLGRGAVSFRVPVSAQDSEMTGIAIGRVTDRKDVSGSGNLAAVNARHQEL